MTTLRTLGATASLATALSMSALAGAMAEAPEFPRIVPLRADVILEWHPETRDLEVTFATGCLSSSAKNVTKDFGVDLDFQSRDLTLTGTYTATWYSRVATADCMNARQTSFTISDVTPGTYQVAFPAQGMDFEVTLADEPVRHIEDRYMRNRVTDQSIDRAN